MYVSSVVFFQTDLPCFDDFERYLQTVTHQTAIACISLDKEESLACQITSLIYKLLKKQAYCLMGKLSGKPVSPLYLKSSMAVE